MLQIRDPSFFFPFFFFIPTFTLIFSKFLFESTAKTIYLGKSSNVLIMIFLQIGQNCVIAVIHYWLRRLHIKLGWPTLFINVFMMGLYIEIFGFTLYDFENTRHNMQIVLPSTYVAYLGRFGMEQKVFHEFWSNIKGTKAHSNSVSNIIKTTILDSPQFWIQMLVVAAVFVVSCIVLVICNWKRIVDSVFTRSYLEKTGDYIPQYSSNQNLLFFNQRNLRNPEYYSLLFIFVHFMALIDIIIEPIILITPEDFKARYFSILPYVSSLFLALSHFEFRPSPQTLNNITNLTRNFLPPGRYWIDTRENPIYPEVHADITDFCAYNPTSSICKEQGASLTSLAGDDSDKKEETKSENNSDAAKNDSEKENESNKENSDKKDSKSTENKEKENSNSESKDKESTSTENKEKEKSEDKDKEKDKEKSEEKDKEKSEDKEKDKEKSEDKEKDKDKEKSEDKEKDKEKSEDKNKENKSTENKENKEETKTENKDNSSTENKDNTSEQKAEPDYIRRIRERRERRRKRLEELKNRRRTPRNEHLTDDELPNVLLFLYESFNPATYLINKDFIDEHVQHPNTLLSDTIFYNKDIMPFLYNFSKEEMVTFSGMQSLGLPSFSGLHSILTQEPPSQTYMNIINGWENDVDDIPSHFHNKGYRTLIVNANRFDFDGKQYWIYKKNRREEALYRMNCLSSYGDSFNDTLQRQIGDYSFVSSMRKTCNDKEIDDFLSNHQEIRSFPKFFDYAAAYYPNKKQAESIGLDPSTVYEQPSISVSGDRIVAKELEAHWKQQREILKSKGEKRPIFTLASSVDGHMPYSGYDMPQFYEKVDPSIKPHTEKMRVANFLRVNKYTDEYFIKEVINWLKENDPNTIILFTGDHGTRDIPAKEKDGEVTKNVKYDRKCVHESTGSDSFFYVTGGISYLGKDERIKRAFGLDKLSGKTIKFTVDHGDMIYTCEEILMRLQGKKLKPTNRKSRNLIDMSLDLLNSNDTNEFSRKIDQSGWRSISMVSHMVEYHNGMRMVRFHPGDIEGAHIYMNCVYPTGLLPVDFDEKKDKRNFFVIREITDIEQKKKALSFVDEALAYLSAENYLAAKNRLYNYRFRDEDCVSSKSCKLPDKLPDLSFRDWPFVNFALNAYLIGCTMLICPALLGALCRFSWIKLKGFRKKEFDSLLNENPVTSL